jgi:hypothetical protein
MMQKLGKNIFFAAFASLLFGLSGGALAQSYSYSVCNLDSQSQSSASGGCAGVQGDYTRALITNSNLSQAGTISGVISGAVSGRAAPGFPRSALMSDGETGLAGSANARWNVWGGYGYSRVGYTFQPLRSGGSVDTFLGGVDYTFMPNLIAGVALSSDRSRIGTTFNNGNLDINGYSVAPYLAWAINRNWVLDASIGFGRGNISQSDRGAAVAITGNNKTDRSFGALSLSYGKRMARWDLTAKASYLFAEDRFSAYTQSNAVAVPGSTVRVGQIRLGGMAAYDAGMFQPFIGLYYATDTQRPTSLAAGGVRPANDRDSIFVQVGANLVTRGPWSAGMSFQSETNRSQVKNDQWLLNVGYRF